ncbi:hypothetical protein Val02_85920 [Virgisporangium aliadipatigenens]|uniref:Uncharacterized protein n=1 Tax=Virgisporangium aliadipatigenens TaxID=741659 RepID=A0A8J3YUF0_9ACTN|nr:hypothetical protein [Virgisporangium aliadipatigenens]GIJ51706.1 hypothetical protein Val02_85920 [Virgisporangium aliadipatigenens]
MNTALEEELAQAIQEAGGAARAPLPQFYTEIERGIARRRRIRRIRAGTAVALVMALGVGAVPLIKRPAPELRPPPVVVAAPLPPTDAARLPDFTNPRSPAEIWPEAVRRLPRQTPDGHGYTPLVWLPDGRLLIRDQPGNPASRFVAWDVTNGARTPLSPALGPGSVTLLGVVAGRVVWSTGSIGVQLRNPTVMASKLDGSGTAPVAELTAPAGERVSLVTIAGESVVWGTSKGGMFTWEGQFTGLWRVPLTGGTAERVPDGNGFIPSWRLPGVVNTTHYGGDGPPDGTVWDLVSGRKVRYTRSPQLSRMACGTVEWCGGSSTDGHAAVQRIDGSGVVVLPATGVVTPLMGGRFAEVVFFRPLAGSRSNEVEITSAALWDVTTGKVANRMMARDDAGQPLPLVESAPNLLLMSWQEGDEILLLDLARVA